MFFSQPRFQFSFKEFFCYLIILEAALPANGVTESDVKEVIRKLLENAPK